MGILDLLDRENLVCTFCGEKPVVGVTFEVDAEVDDSGAPVSHELIKTSLVAVCKAHLPILQEKFEKEAQDADFIDEVSDVETI